MKKIIRFLLLTTLSLMLGCDIKEDEQLLVDEFFSVKIDGEDYVFDTFDVYKYNDNYEVRGSINNQETLYIRFNANGVLDRAHFYNTGTPNQINYKTFYYFPKETFRISNLIIDDTNNVVKANFEGLIYDDSFDLSSDTMSVTQGVFNLVFIDSMPNEDEFIDATVDGQRFESMKHFETSYDLGGFRISGMSDNEYTLTLNLGEEPFLAGTYMFSNSNEINSVGIEFNDPYNDISEAYNVSGTLVIDELESEFSAHVSGSFNGIATNSNGDTFIVSNGVFNLNFI